MKRHITGLAINDMTKSYIKDLYTVINDFQGNRF